MKNLLLFSFILFASLSCRKDENSIIIQGVVTDINTGEPVKDIKLKLYDVKSGLFGKDQDFIKSDKTDENGFYKFKIRPRETASYRMEIYRGNENLFGFYIPSGFNDSIMVGIPYIKNLEVQL